MESVMNLFDTLFHWNRCFIPFSMIVGLAAISLLWLTFFCLGINGEE